MKINKILMGAAILATLVSCSKSFLETTPTDSVSASTVISSTEIVSKVINGIAFEMVSQQAAYSQGVCGENRIISIYNEYPSEEFIYNPMAPGWSPIMNGDYYSRANTSYSNYPWYYYYKIIFNANSIIVNIDKAIGTDEEKAFYKAQALTFRAWAYTKLLQIYSVRWKDSNSGSANGVILRLDESTGSIPLSSMAQCYAQIYKDLDEAINGFKTSGMDRGARETWLPNLNVAYAIYAKAALDREDYDTALTNARLAQDGYPLMSNADYVSGFCGPTSEWIFGSYASADENKWYWTFGTQFACNGYYASASSYGTGAINNQCTDRIPDNDIRKSLFLTKDKFPGYDFSDPKNVNQTNAQIVGDELWREAYEYIESMNPGYDEGAYESGYIFVNSQLKFWVFDTPGVSCLPFIRTSEMVLIEAEASYFLDKTGADAQAALNKLNENRQPGYNCEKTGEDLFEEIVLYRQLELWGEGFNWADHKRWKRDIVRKSISDGGICHIAASGTFSANKEWTWAIPETETLYNKEIAK